METTENTKIYYVTSLLRSKKTEIHNNSLIVIATIGPKSWKNYRIFLKDVHPNAEIHVNYYKTTRGHDVLKELSGSPIKGFEDFKKYKSRQDGIILKIPNIDKVFCMEIKINNETRTFFVYRSTDFNVQEGVYKKPSLSTLRGVDHYSVDTILDF